MTVAILFSPDGAVFACVGVKAGHGDARWRDAEAGRGRARQSGRFGDQPAG